MYNFFRLKLFASNPHDLNTWRNRPITMQRNVEGVGNGTMHEGDLLEGKFANTYRPFVPKCGFG